MPKLSIVAGGLVLLVNVVVLSGIAYNRSEHSLAHLVLTERELTVINRYSSGDENSGMALELNWNMLSYSDNNKLEFRKWGSPEWLNKEKYRQLGIDVGSREEKDDYEIQSIEVIYVFEFDGADYQRALALSKGELEQARLELKKNPGDENLQSQVESLNAELQRLRLSESRLFIIDVALDQQVLLEKYQDKTKYLFLRGELQPYWSEKKLYAGLRDPFISSVHVPRPYSDMIENATGDERYDVYGKDPIEPRYLVNLNLGKRLEPWVDTVLIPEN